MRKPNTFEESKYIVDLEEMERGETRDSATQGGTGDEPKSHETRQGETPEVTPFQCSNNVCFMLMGLSIRLGNRYLFSYIQKHEY
jgi:hypothetical protein